MLTVFLLKTLLWIILSIFLFFSWDLLFFSLNIRGPKKFLYSSTLYYSTIIFSEMLLGFVSLLTPLPLAFVIFGVAFFLTCYKKRNIIDYFGSHKKFILESYKRLKENKFSLLITLLTFFLIVWIVFLGTVFPVTDWDGNSYHMTFIGQVIQNKNIYDVPASLPWIIGYPKGGELISLWNVIFLQRDTFVDLYQLPFLLIACVSVYSIALKFTKRKDLAYFGSALFVFIPIVINQLKTTYVDVVLPSLFFAGLTISLEEKLKKLDLFVLFLIASMILSIKLTGIIFVFVFVVLVLPKLYKNYIIEKKHKDLIKILLLAIAAFSIGLYWYIKNFVIYSTPIYPFGFKMLGISIFPGKTFFEFAAPALQNSALPKGLFSKIWFTWTEQKDWWGCLYNYDANYSGLGPIWFILLLPATILLFLKGLIQKNIKVLLLMAIFLGVFLLYPLNYYPRYTLFIVGLGIVSFVIILTQLNNFSQKIVKIITLLLAVVVLASNFALCNYPPSILKSQLKNNKILEDKGIGYKNVVGNAFYYIHNRIQKGEKIGYSKHSMFVYPLWNDGLTNEVYYIGDKNYEDWIKGIKSLDLDYYFIAKVDTEKVWIKDLTKYKRIYEDSDYEIYKKDK